MLRDLRKNGLLTQLFNMITDVYQEVPTKITADDGEPTIHLQRVIIKIPP